MNKKREERVRKKELKHEKFERSRALFLAKVQQKIIPQQSIIVTGGIQPRLAPHLERLAYEKLSNTPKTIKSGSRFDQQVTWCISEADQHDEWSWGEPRRWDDTEWFSIIAPKFKELSNLTWREIDSFSSDTGHRMHHGHEVGDLIEEAQGRWRELDLEQFESIFRFRLGGQKRRAWGFIVQAHFHMVWWDRNHSLYPTEPK